jgi:hypothetical protein
VKGRRRGLMGWSEDGDAAGVAAEVFEEQADLGPGGREGEALRPLQDDDRRGGEHVLHAKSFKVVKSLDAVEVGMKDLGGLAIDVDEGEGRAGDVVFAGSAESGHDAFGESRFSGAEIAGKED